MHFFQLSSLITFKILQIGHFLGVLPPCFTSLAIRKIILRHPKCLQKNSKACFFPLVRCGRDGTENPSFTHIDQLITVCLQNQNLYLFQFLICSLRRPLFFLSACWNLFDCKFQTFDSEHSNNKIICHML